MADVPASLKTVKPYIQLAADMDSKDPVIAYHCRLYSLQEAMKLRSSLPKADMGYVLGLMDRLEKDKGALGEMDAPSVQVEHYAQDLFRRADDNDRAGKLDAGTAKAFIASAQLFRVCSQFGELPDDMKEKEKYAKVRFVEFGKAKKEGRAPAPPRGDPVEDDILPPPAVGDFGEVPPPPPPAPGDPYGLPATGPPSYMGLGDPPAVPDSNPYGLPPQQPPPHYPAAPANPVPPQPQRFASPPSAPAAPSVPAAPPGFKPTREAIVEVFRLMKSAEAALQFQETDAAASQLHHAIGLLQNAVSKLTRP